MRGLNKKLKLSLTMQKRGIQSSQRTEAPLQLNSWLLLFFKTTSKDSVRTFIPFRSCSDYEWTFVSVFLGIKKKFKIERKLVVEFPKYDIRGMIMMGTMNSDRKKKKKKKT